MMSFLEKLIEKLSTENVDSSTQDAVNQSFRNIHNPRSYNLGGTFRSYSPFSYYRNVNIYNRGLFPSLNIMTKDSKLREKIQKELTRRINGMRKL